jgi:hypothetical protein
MDAAALPPGYRLQVVPAEYAPGGIFAHLDEWLAANATRHGFHRPYATWRGGVQPEPWHVSHAAVAGAAMAQFSVATLRRALEDAPLAAREAVMKKLPAIVERYVLNVDPPPPAAGFSADRATRPA